MGLPREAKVGSIHTIRTKAGKKMSFKRMTKKPGFGAWQIVGSKKK